MTSELEGELDGEDRAAVRIGQQSVASGGTGVVVSLAGNPPGRRTTLPNRGPFFGRSSDLEAMTRALSEQSRTKTLVLAGARGVGKTHLAIQFAETQHSRYPGGTLFVDFDAPREARLADLCAAFPERASQTRVRHLLAGISRPTLIIYDGVSWASELDDWWPSGPVHVIVTTLREDLLRPADNTVQWVEPLLEQDALQLAEHHLGATHASFRDELVQRAKGNSAVLVQDAIAVATHHDHCPYAGLEPFAEIKHDFFFGREGLISELLAQVHEHAIVAVFGRSGSGKSSLVAAGLLPRLRTNPSSAGWDVLHLRPTGSPLHALVVAIQSQEPAENVAQCIEDNVRQLREGRGKALEGLLARRFARASSKPTRLLLFVDQWEELYLLAATTHPAARAQRNDAKLFVDLLKTLERSATIPTRIVAAVRADCYGWFRATGFAGHLPGHDVHVGPLRLQEVLDAICRPAEKAGLSFDDNLPDEMANDVGSDEALLPLLQYALYETWVRREGLRLTRRGYADAGRVSGALIGNANRTYDQLDESERAAARELFLGFVIPGEGRLDTCAPVEMPRSGPKARVAEKFAAPNVRILVIGMDSASQPTVGVAHEALVRQWPLLAGWIDEKRENLHLRATLVRYKNEWIKSKRRADALLRPGYTLNLARALLAAPDGLPVDDLRDFVHRSEKQERRARYLRNAVWSAILICSVGLLVHLSRQNQTLAGRTAENISLTHALRESLARYVTLNVTENIQVQCAELAQLASNPRVAQILERTMNASTAGAPDDDQLLRLPSFHSTLVLDENGCPIALWPVKYSTESRAWTLQTCRADVARMLSPDEVGKREWWARTFRFREYFGTAVRAARAGDPPLYPVSRSFRSEDDDALKYAISLPVRYGDGKVGVLLGTAPGKLGQFDGADPAKLVTGLIGVRGRERDSNTTPGEPLLLLKRSDISGGPLAARPVDPFGAGILEAVHAAGLARGASDERAGLDATEPCELQPKTEVHEVMWTDSTDSRWSAAVQQIGCAGLVAFAATRMAE